MNTADAAQKFLAEKESVTTVKTMTAYRSSLTLFSHWALGKNLSDVEQLKRAIPGISELPSFR